MQPLSVWLSGNIIHPGYATAAIGALLVGKVVLISDNLPLMNKFPDKTLFYNIAWQSVMYFLATFLVHYIDTRFHYPKSMAILRWPTIIWWRN